MKDSAHWSKKSSAQDRDGETGFSGTMYEENGLYLGSHIETDFYVSLVYFSLNNPITFFSQDTDFFEAFKEAVL